MAKRRTREELREEYLKLLEIWHHVRAFHVCQAKQAGLVDSEALIPKTKDLLGRFDNGPGTPSEHLRSLKGEFQQMSVGFASGVKHGEKTSFDFLAFYLKASGRNFFADVGDQSRQIAAILDRGHLLDEDEFRLIKMCLDDDLDLIPTELISKANAMLAEFEYNALP